MTHLLKSRCNTCLFKEHRRWCKDNPERVREYRQKDSWTLAKRCHRRGISPEMLITAYESQGCKCAICRSDVELMQSAIDHNHNTGTFRGLLCKTCNRALGMFRDDPAILQSAMEYLKLKGNYANGT